MNAREAQRPARELLNAATPRPWFIACRHSEVLGDVLDDVWIWGPDGDDATQIIPAATARADGDTHPNDRLIVAAVNEYEALLDLEENLRGYLRTLEMPAADYANADYNLRVSEALARLDALRSSQ